MNQTKGYLALIALVVAVATPGITLADEAMVVVVSSKNPINKMSIDEIQQIFMGQSEFFPGGGTAVAVDLPDTSPDKSVFVTKVLGKTPTQLHAYWSKMVFTGKGKLLKELPTSKDVIEYLGKNPSAIGYMEKSAVDSNVKVVYAF